MDKNQRVQNEWRSVIVIILYIFVCLQLGVRRLPPGEGGPQEAGATLPDSCARQTYLQRNTSPQKHAPRKRKLFLSINLPTAHYFWKYEGRIMEFCNFCKNVKTTFFPFFGVGGWGGGVHRTAYQTQKESYLKARIK